MRITKKYFRDKVNSGGIATTLALLPMIVAKYGENPKGHRKMKSIRVSKPSDWWNHYITEFYFYKDKLFANVYWQGGDTDGDSSIQIKPGTFSYRIPAEYFDDGYRTRCIHGDIVIDREEILEAVKRLLN